MRTNTEIDRIIWRLPYVQSKENEILKTVSQINKKLPENKRLMAVLTLIKLQMFSPTRTRCHQVSPLT